MAHHEVAVKVTAWVDEGIAELVTALNALPGVMTLSSCQEGTDGLARVSFCTHEDEALYGAVSHIAEIIGAGRREAVTLSLWWGADDAPPVADLACPPRLVSAVAGTLRSSAARTTA
jgi:hypothetical protein